MNRHVRALLEAFQDTQNVAMLGRTVRNHYKNPRVDIYIRDHFGGAIRNFAVTIEHELMDSDPIPGTMFSEEIEMLNQRFIDEQVEIIRDFVAPEPAAMYSVDDGRPTTRLGTAKSADEMLSDWYYARRQPQFRDDRNERGTVHSDLGGREVTGVTFCDQSEVGLQNHIDQYENTSTKLALNKYLPHEAVAFGVSTPGSDARLMSRRIFRSENGVENGIPARQRWLHKRHYDREMDETFYAETGHMSRGYDMAPTYRKVAAAARAPGYVYPNMNSTAHQRRY